MLHGLTIVIPFFANYSLGTRLSMSIPINFVIPMIEDIHHDYPWSLPLLMNDTRIKPTFIDQIPPTLKVDLVEVKTKFWRPILEGEMCPRQEWNRQPLVSSPHIICLYFYNKILVHLEVCHFRNFRIIMSFRNPRRLNISRTCIDMILHLGPNHSEQNRYEIIGTIHYFSLNISQYLISCLTFLVSPIIGGEIIEHPWYNSENFKIMHDTFSQIVHFSISTCSHKLTLLFNKSH